MYIGKGNWFTYRNRHGQTMRGKLVDLYANKDGFIFLMVKRPEWPSIEALLATDFRHNNGTEYEVLAVERGRS